MHYQHIVDWAGIAYLEGRFSIAGADPMKILLVFAHPEPLSLNGALRDVAIKELETQGHEVRVSDLYADGWKSEVDRADFPSLAPDGRFIPVAASKEAFDANALTKDVKVEIENLLWADTLILQFPLWWFAMPAILNAMLLVTTGGWEEHYAARGVNGPIDDLLFPINHGILYYPGYDVLPPFVVYRVDRLDESGFEPIAERLRERMRTLATTPPIPYRQQNGGDYLIPSMNLRPELSEQGTTGFALHLNGAGADGSRSRPLSMMQSRLIKCDGVGGKATST